MIKPDWLRKPRASAAGAAHVRGRIADGRLNTVCRSARCPNMGECYSRGTATFLILGSECSRDCGFCAVPHGQPAGKVDSGEPERVAHAAQRMGLSHVVVTSVTRDDLPDGGAGIFAETIEAIRRALPEATVEVLTPDFGGDWRAVDIVAQAGPDVFNHNMETVRELYKVVRPSAIYERSLELINRVYTCDGSIMTKSGFMLGLGESRDQVIELMGDLRNAGCQVVTIGQYLQPTMAHLPVAEYAPPEVFEKMAREGERLGLAKVFAGPLVRSSYMAEDLLAPVDNRN